MDSVTALTAGLIDYAGLFPPAKLGMREAVENYAEYLQGPDAPALGKFIVPASRLDELEQCAGDLPVALNARSVWRLSVLVNEDDPGAMRSISGFQARHAESSARSLARIEAVEMPYSLLAGFSSSGIREIVNDAYFEVGAPDDVERAIPLLKAAGSRAKLRTGGTTATAFPTTHRVVRFLRACCNSGVPFKATAGLHHPVRAEYPLTYEPRSERSTMFGFLNLFLAAAFIWNGADDETAAGILDESDPSAFGFSAGAIGWRGSEISTNRIAEARRAFAISFGSCSFREPVDELGLLTKGVAAR